MPLLSGRWKVFAQSSRGSNQFGIRNDTVVVHPVSASSPTASNHPALRRTRSIRPPSHLLQIARRGYPCSMSDWFLTPDERGNPATDIDRDGSWSDGNLVRPLIHGAVYFQHLYDELCALRTGDRVYFTDWRGDADESLAPGGPTVAAPEPRRPALRNRC